MLKEDDIQNELKPTQPPDNELQWLLSLSVYIKTCFKDKNNNKSHCLQVFKLCQIFSTPKSFVRISVQSKYVCIWIQML